MVPAVFTTLLFAMSAVFAGRATRILGGTLANFIRLCLATLLLGIWAFAFGGGLEGGALGWFFLSGCIGFGLGDVALYQALPRIGSRLSILMVHCLAAPIAIGVERVWLGTTLSLVQLAGGAMILCGVGLALAPSEHLRIDRATLIAGVVFGLIAAVGQAGGAVVSRKAYLLVSASGQSVDGGTAAFQRILGGVLFSGLPLLWMALDKGFREGAASGEPGDFRSRFRKALPWVVLNCVTGPTAGVACYQWALATAPSGVVLPIIAITPLAVIPLSYHMEKDRPGMRAVAGGVLAVLGAIVLARTRF